MTTCGTLSILLGGVCASLPRHSSRDPFDLHVRDRAVDAKVPHQFPRRHLPEVHRMDHPRQGRRRPPQVPPGPAATLRQRKPQEQTRTLHFQVQSAIFCSNWETQAFLKKKTLIFIFVQKRKESLRNCHKKVFE